MKVQIKEIAQGKWAIYLVSSLGVSGGHTTYASSEEAEEEARVQHPDKEIEVIH